MLRAAVLMVPKPWAEVPRRHHRKFTGSLHNILNFCETPHGLLDCVILVSKLDHTLFFLRMSSLCAAGFLSVAMIKKQILCEHRCGTGKEGVASGSRSCAVPNRHTHPTSW